MSKTVTLRLPEATYRRFAILAERENRPLSNFIEHAAFRYTESDQYADDFEMAEIQTNADLNRSLKRGVNDAKAGRGQFV
jgi:predicted transcriptional regulator